MVSLAAAMVFAGTNQAGANAVLEAPSDPMAVRRDATVAAVERVMPSVVNIATETVVEYRDWYQDQMRRFFGAPLEPGRRALTPSSIGSGVIIHEDGYVLTNLHVVRRAARTWVKLWDGRTREAEPLVVAIPQTDVALLKIKAEPGEKFQAIRFALDDDLLLGETVIALGNPFGLGGSVSRGILSSKSRRLDVEGESLTEQDWLQTDAAINPGNSGGPLVNLNGELIGLNVAMRQGAENIGFAIPVKYVASALSEFFTPEVSQHLWFGARFRHQSEPLTVSRVLPDSPAERAGLREGDHLLRVNGDAPAGLIELPDLLAVDEPYAVALEISRDGETRTLKTSLIPFETMIAQKTGLTLSELPQNRARQIGLRGGAGLVVSGVEKSSPADKAKLETGFLITALDGKALENLFSFGDLLTGRPGGETIRLTILVPGGSRGFVTYRQFQVELVVR
jgi:S1-C subfamily serine protease